MGVVVQWQVNLDLLNGGLAGRRSSVLVSRGIVGRLVGQQDLRGGVLMLQQDLRSVKVVGWGMWWYAEACSAY